MLIPKKPKIKVTGQTIKLRFEIAHADPEYLKKHGKLFALSDMSQKFKVTKQMCWYWTSGNPKYQKTPSKDKCPHCGVSNYSQVSRWINDGSLNHLLQISTTKGKK